MTEHDTKEGYLYVRQGKTSAKLRIEVIGELKAVIERIRMRRRTYKVMTRTLSSISMVDL